MKKTLTIIALSLAVFSGGAVAEDSYSRMLQQMYDDVDTSPRDTGPSLNETIQNRLDRRATQNRNQNLDTFLLYESLDRAQDGARTYDEQYESY